MPRIPTGGKGSVRLAAVGSPKAGILHSWKEIAAYLRHGVRTVQRWEESEGLPVHRHPHEKRDSVYAYAAELDTWWTSHRVTLEQGGEKEANHPQESLIGSRAGRRSRLLLALGAVVLVLIAAAGVRLRWYGPQSGSTALSFAPRDWVLIGDFDNQTGEAIFDRSLWTAFTVSLEQSPHANVFPRSRVIVTLQRMGRNIETKIDEQIGREICLREHLRGLISCSITKTGREYALAARLIDPQTGAALRSYFEPSSDQDRIIATLGKITARIRRDLGESLASIRQNDEPLPLVTTSSLEALKLFSEGRSLWRRGEYTPAVKAYQSALEYDPEFAMAHAALGGAYMSHIFSSPLQGKEHYEKALRRADRITERERLYIQASYQDSLDHLEEAVRDYRVYLNAFPDDSGARFNLGGLLMRNQRAQEAMEEFRAALRLDPANARAWIGLANTRNELGRSDDALIDYAKAFELEPSWITLGNLNHEYGFTLVQAGNTAKARDVFNLALAKPGMEDHALRSLAMLNMYEGKYGNAQGQLQRAILLSAADPDPMSGARHRLYLAILLDGRGDRASQLRELDRATESLANWPDPQIWLLARLGAAYARAGAIAKADRILRKLSPQEDRANPSNTAELHILEGELALAGGNYVKAIMKLQLGAQAVPLPLGLAGLAHAYQTTGNTNQAIACYERLIGLGWRVLGWEPQQAWIMAHADLAQAYLSRGERDKAEHVLDELARLWKDADPDLPLVKRIAALKKRLANGDL